MKSSIAELVFQHERPRNHEADRTIGVGHIICNADTQWDGWIGWICGSDHVRSLFSITLGNSPDHFRRR